MGRCQLFLWNEVNIGVDKMVMLQAAFADNNTDEIVMIKVMLIL